MSNEFEIGQRVRFRLGERENHVCPECQWAYYDSDYERALVELSGDILNIIDIRQADEILTRCLNCGDVRGETLEATIVLGTPSDYADILGAIGFCVFPSEVELIHEPEQH